MTTWRARLRRLRFAVFALLATLIIAVGVLAALTQLAMPWLSHHPQHVERWLSQRLDRPVTIGKVDGSWIGGGPVLALDDVRIGGAAATQATFAIPHAELVFDLSALFRRNRALTEFRLGGLDLQVSRDAAGWHLRGLDMGANPDAGDDDPPSLGALGAVEIRDLKLTLDDPSHDLHLALGAPVVRLLNRGDVIHVVGRVRLLDTDSPPLDLVADIDAAKRSGELYVGGRDIDVGRVVAQQSPGGVQLVSGRGDLQLWAKVAAAQPDDVRVHVDLHDARFASALPIATDARTSVTPRVAFDRLAFVARWLREADGWTFDLANFVADAGVNTQPARLTVERRGDDASPRYRVGASALPIEPLGNLGMLAERVPEGARRWLYLAHPRGSVASADVAWRGADDYDVNASMQRIALASSGAAPGVDPFDAELHGDAQALLLQVPKQALRIDYPHIFRRPFLFGEFAGDVVARRTDDAWRIETDRIAFQGEGYGADVRGSVDIEDDGSKPTLDLAAAITRADVVAAKLFWPTVTMSPKAIAWLDRAIVGGHLVDARIAIRGGLDTWPFHDRSGVLVATGDLVDLDVDYDPNWPRAEKLHGRIGFVNDGMQVDIDSANALGNHISEATATIADFGPLVLDLRAKGNGSGANLLEFLRATPVGKHFQDQLKDIAIGGKGDVAFALTLPIKEVEALTLDGSVDLVGATLDHDPYNLHFTDVNGRLRFDRKGFIADKLDVSFRDRKAVLGVAIGGFVADPKHAFEAGLGGRFPVTAVFADVPVLAPALARFPGESTWNVAVAIDASETGNGRSHLALNSDLRGTAIDLPAPLEKSADVAMPFRLDVDLPFTGQVVDARIGDVVAVKARLPTSTVPFAAAVEFGGTSPAAIPAQGVAIDGRVKALDAGGWIDFVEIGSGGPGSGVLRSIDVASDDFVMSDRHFGAVRLLVKNGVAGTEIRLDGEPLAGTLTIPGTDLVGRGVTAKFERIHWPESPPDAPDTNAVGDVAPGTLPPLHLSVADFRLGTASFGAADFDSHPIANGMHVDKLDARSPNIDMHASGDWTGSARDNRTHLAVELSAQSLGRMMDALGFAGILDGGATRAKIDATWAGPPSAFALPKLDGTLAIDVAEGRILDVNTPGAGRIFGLFSLTEIPRRLSLDFSDFFKSGFSFTSIIGTFRLADGNAFTDGLTIKSPAADIVVTGRTGLRAKDYDQTMNVSPHAGSTLPIVGAIAAGPVGAAAGLVMQSILNKPLGKAIGSKYKVSGSWDKPKITLIARTTARGKAETKVEEEAEPAPETPGKPDS